MSAVTEIMSKLDPKTRQRVQTALEVETPKQKTPSIGLNMALRGGLGHGRQVLVWGNKSAGKSSFCLQLIAEAQKEGKSCAWIDAENSYSQDWAEKLGVDSENLIYSPAKTINDMVDVATQLMEAEVDIIVVDSISALLPAIYFEKDSSELKKLEDTKQIGAEAKDMTGRPVNWIIDYNKLGPPNLSGQYDFYFQGDHVGVDGVGEILDVAEQFGVVEKGGAWYTVLGERFQGRAKTVEWLRNNPEAVDKLREEVYAKS